MQRVKAIGRALERMYLASGMWVAYAYTGAASLIGFEALTVLIGYSTAWPVGIPLTIAALAIVYFVKRRLRPDSTPDKGMDEGAVSDAAPGPETSASPDTTTGPTGTTVPGADATPDKDPVLTS